MAEGFATPRGASFHLQSEVDMILDAIGDVTRGAGLGSMAVVLSTTVEYVSDPKTPRISKEQRTKLLEAVARIEACSLKIMPAWMPPAYVHDGLKALASQIVRWAVPCSLLSDDDRVVNREIDLAAQALQYMCDAIACTEEAEITRGRLRHALDWRSHAGVPYEHGMSVEDPTAVSPAVAAVA